MTSQPAVLPDIASRRPPALGGFNLTVLAIEIRRLTRNRRTMLFTIVLPVVFFLIFGLNSAYARDPLAHGNESAFIMVSMALYGGVLATTSGGAMVSIERAAGWSRQLRLTPLSPVAYIVIKMLTAMVLGLTSVLAVFIVGRATGVPHLEGYLWVVVGPDRLGRGAGLRCLRAVHGLPAADRERHADPLVRAGPIRVRRRAVHPAEPVLAPAAAHR